MQILAITANKGGTGKSTSAAALAQAAASTGRKVLAIDLDPQGNLSFMLNADQTGGGSLELLHGADPAQLIRHTSQGVDAITATPELSQERTAQGSGRRLAKALRQIRDNYDLIIIDATPHNGELVFNALQAADGLLIPLDTDNSSLQGLYQTTDIAHQIQRSNPGLEILGAILTKYDNRPKINRYIREVMAETGAEIGAPLLMVIRPGIAIKEAQSLQRSLYEYAPKSNPAADYMELLELLTKDR